MLSELFRGFDISASAMGAERLRMTVVDESQRQYDQAIRAVERGEADNLHRVMLAQSQAQLSLRLAVEVRNKLVEAYKELNRTQF